MTGLRRISSLFRNLVLSNRVERELDEEVRSYLALLIDEKIAAGMSAEEAHRAARIELGGIDQVKEKVRDIRKGAMIEQLWQDLRYGFRIIRKSPGFTAVAVLSLALGIGANTAIFQLIDAVRLRELPVKDPGELAAVWFDHEGWYAGSLDGRYPVLTNSIWEQIRDRQEAFSSAFAWSADTFNLAAGGEARYAQGLWVSGDFFNVLEVTPMLGRVFSAADDRKGNGFDGAVISYPFWQREFGGDTSVLGRKLTLNGHSFEVIGVTPAGFFGVEVGRTFDVAVVLCAEPIIRAEESKLDTPNGWWLSCMGRLKPGWSMAQASSHLDSISPGIFEATMPAFYKGEVAKHYLAFKLKALPGGSGISSLRESYENPLWLLMALAGVVLLIACANLANLMLARASAREREIAVRIALGAWRSRLVRQLLAESTLLAGAGAVLGALLARVASEFLVSFLSTGKDPLFVDVVLDWRLLAFTVGAAVLTCVLFGLTPALTATNTAPNAVLKSGGRGLTASRELFNLRRVLVVSQVALSLVLVAGALLFVRSLQNLVNLNPGFRQDGILIASLDLTRLDLPKDRRQPFEQDLLERIRTLPGIDSAAEARMGEWGEYSNAPPLGDGPEFAPKGQTNLNSVSSRYFETLGIPMLAGRDFDEHDTATSAKVVIVNESFAARYLDGPNPIGQMIRIGEPNLVFQVAGLVGNTKYQDVREEFPPIAFFPQSQRKKPDLFDHVYVRSSMALSGLVPALRSTIAAVNPNINFEFHVFKTQLRDTLLPERLMATLSGFFGVLALALASIGLYGVMSYGVASRTNEIGIRMALGAQARGVLWLILREALLMVLIGVAVGLPAVLLATRFISSLLFGLTPTDPVSISVAALGMLAVAAVAGYVPARRASRVDPMVALRHE
jgi:putative ABC transport system permease protein